MKDRGDGLASARSHRAPLVVRVGAYPHRVSDTVAWERRALESRGCAYAFVESQDDLAERDASEAIGVIASSGVWNAAAFSRLPNCRILVSCSVGLDTVEVQAATSLGICVCHMPDLCTDEVADHAFALLLACVRKTARLNNRVHTGIWDRKLLEPMPRLRGSTLGLLGFGRIARAVATRAQAFGMRVIAYDPYVDRELAHSMDVELVELETLCRDSDVISCHIPLNAHTARSIDEACFRAMKPSAYFINTSRGAVVDQEALVGALQAGEIRGAGLDVLEDEPPSPGNPLLQMENVLLTPHAAGFSDEVVMDIPRLAVQAILSYIKTGRPPSHGCVNVDALSVANALS